MQAKSKFLTYELDMRVVYKRYASLFIIAGIDLEENELMALEWIQRFVEILDQYFGNVLTAFSP